MDAIDFFELLSFVLGILAALGAPLLVIVVVVFIYLRNAKFQRRRAEEMRGFAARNGFNFIGEPPVEGVPGSVYFRLFNLGSGYGRRIENAFQATTGDGYRLSVFDYRYYETFNNRKNHRQTVVMISSERINLPWFSLMPQGTGLLQRLQNALDPDINFPSNPGFSANYLLLGQDEAGIRRVFHPGVLAYFEGARGGGGGFVVEGGGNTMLFYGYDRLAAPEQLGPTMDEALRIAKTFAR